MIIYKREDATAYLGWDFSDELPDGETLQNSSDVKIFDPTGADITADLLRDKSITGNEIDVVIKKGGTNLNDYRIVFYGVTENLTPTHEVTMKIRDSG